MDEQDWDNLGWLKSSENRRNITNALFDSPKTPSELSENLDVHINHISNYLSDLAERSLVECVTPERKKGRIYRLTEKGKKLSKRLN